MHLDPNVASYGASIQLQVKTIDRVLSSISHDLKNPLSIVRGNAQLAMMVNKDEKVRTCLGRIIDAVDGMTLILDEVRGLRKAPTDSKGVTALDHLLKCVLDQMKSQLIKSSITLNVQVPEQVAIEANGELMQCAIRHIIQNAVDAMPDGGVLSVELRVHEEKVYLAITDTGKGIPVELQEKICKEFFTTKTGASGWGLVLVDQIIRVSHGGSVQFISGERGTTFTVSLPLYIEVSNLA